MTPEIKRLLKLSSIPNFKLSVKELTVLEAWKAKQEPVRVKHKTRSKASKTPSKAPLEPETIVVPPEAIVKVQNVVRPEDLILNSES